MSSPLELKPIKVYGKGGPNPPKVAMVLAELGLPHDLLSIPFSDVKNPEYLAINPNGRLPSIHDPNTDITVWESGAIVLYLVNRYDTEHRISFPPGTPEFHHAQQWLFFQASGQGPYYGQAAWFKKFHHENIPSAVERYIKEVHRVTNVLEGWLTEQKKLYPGSGDGPWLVGNKFSYADISFVSWQVIISEVVTNDEFAPDDFPVVKDWLARMMSRPAMKAALGAKEELK
ncbi:glutathione S-transferase Ure2-like protein [Podospora appendiculata]|uniref:Glutathione S-transferase Ure2-like protein n=1 Tax=Podospora appendiculata TaxID=314037 RepID=A0AAE0XBH8_9PEZI|nr:glutathione S-transferase Ure2-like protein [Podospora appendiculata]